MVTLSYHIIIYDKELARTQCTDLAKISRATLHWTGSGSSLFRVAAMTMMISDYVDCCMILIPVCHIRRPSVMHTASVESLVSKVNGWLDSLHICCILSFVALFLLHCCILLFHQMVFSCFWYIT